GSRWIRSLPPEYREREEAEGPDRRSQLHPSSRRIGLTTPPASATNTASSIRGPSPVTLVRKEPPMSRTVALVAFCLLASTALVARGAGKGDLQAAVKKLADAPSYAWTSETKGGFGGGTAEGKAEKDGFTVVKMHVFENDIEVVKK